MGKNKTPCTQQQFEAVCDLIETSPGNIPSKCKEIGISSASFYKMLQIPENEKRYARAKEYQCEPIFQEMFNVANEPLPTTAMGSLDGAAVQDKRVRIDVYKWALSKLMPKRYGDKVDFTSLGDKIAAPIINVMSEEHRKKISEFDNTLDAI